MDPTTYKDPELTLQDKMVVEVLLDDIGANGANCPTVSLLTNH
jgi:hypothetical protein